MKRFTNMMGRIFKNEDAIWVVRSILIGLMLIAIFYHVVNTDFSTAPEFIYNQF